jgi:hypothetical protein
MAFLVSCNYITIWNMSLVLRVFLLEGDSLIVVQAINCIGENWSKYENIITNIQAVLTGFNIWKTCNTKRINSTAHILAQIKSHNNYF